MQMCRCEGGGFSEHKKQEDSFFLLPQTMIVSSTVLSIRPVMSPAFSVGSLEQRVLQTRKSFGNISCPIEKNNLHGNKIVIRGSPNSINIVAILENIAVTEVH